MTNTNTRSMRASATDYADEARGIAGQALETTKELANRAGEKVRDLRYGVKDLASKGASSVGEYAQATTRYVSEQPVRSALIAATTTDATTPGFAMAMVHPIFSVLITRPELVVDHVAGYAALVQEEASNVGLEVAKRVIAWAVAALGLLVFLVLAGVAVMLGAIHEFHWALVLAPGVALLVSVLAWSFARQRLPAKAFTELKAQLDADAQALRTLGAST